MKADYSPLPPSGGGGQGVRGDFDLAIIGGGPAGCSAAIRAAQSGLRTVLFEARTYPHDKLCGEFLSPECAALLTALDAWPTVRHLSPHPIEIVRLTTPNGSTWQTRWPETAWGLTRKTLDAVLAQRAGEAGAVVQTGATVLGLQGNLQTGFRLEIQSAAGRQTVHARAVIAAYGKRAALDRRLGREFLRRPQPFVAFKVHVHHLDIPGQIELHTFPGGYCGMSHIEPDSSSMSAGVPPAGEHAPANVCFLAHQSVFRRTQQPGKKPLAAFLDWMVHQNPHLHARLAPGFSLSELQSRDWLSIAAVPFTPKTPLEGDLLMAGDAAGLIVPLAGDGIAMALHSGMLAAACAASYLQGICTAEELRRQYRRRWRRAFSARLAIGRLLQAIMLRPPLISAGLSLVRMYPALGRYFLTHTRELDPFDPNEFTHDEIVSDGVADPFHHLPGNRRSGESLRPDRDL